MYYYLDKDDGYTKGPYAWEELKRLPLLPETYVYNKIRREWRTLNQYQGQMAAEATREVTRKTRKKTATPTPARQPEPEVNRPVYQPMPMPESRQPEIRFPRPGSIQLPEKGAAPAMGVSGAGCFIAAVLLVLLVIGFIVLMGN